MRPSLDFREFLVCLAIICETGSLDTVGRRFLLAVVGSDNQRRSFERPVLRVRGSFVAWMTSSSKSENRSSAGPFGVLRANEPR